MPKSLKKQKQEKEIIDEPSLHQPIGGAMVGAGVGQVVAAITGLDSTLVTTFCSAAGSQVPGALNSMNAKDDAIGNKEEANAVNQGTTTSSVSNSGGLPIASMTLSMWSPQKNKANDSREAESEIEQNGGWQSFCEGAIEKLSPISNEFEDSGTPAPISSSPRFADFLSTAIVFIGISKYLWDNRFKKD